MKKITILFSIYSISLLSVFGGVQEQVLYQETDTFNSTSKVFFTNPQNTYAGTIDIANGAKTSTYSEVSGFATSATTSAFATNAQSTDTARYATSATTAAYATNALYAGTANQALFSNGANTANWSAVSSLASNLVGGIPSSVTSIYTRALIDDSDLITISNRVIYNAAGNKIADLNAFIIYSNGVISADFDKRLFYNFSGNKVFDYNLGKLYNAAGTVTIIDILEGMIRTPAGGQSVDYKNRLLYSSSGDASVNYNTLKLLGPWSVDTTADEDGEIVDYTLLTNVYYTITDEYTNAIDLAIQAYSNYMNTVTNDFQDQILNQSNRINGVSNYVVNITNEYVRTNHTLTINGTVGNFDSNLNFIISGGGATESTTNYIDAGNLANSNHTIGVSNFVNNTALNWTNNTYINLSSRWLMSGGQAVLRWGSSTLYDAGNHLTLNWDARTLVGDDVISDDPWEIDIRPIDDYDIADIYTVTTSVHSLSNSLILALNSSTNALRNELTNYIDAGNLAGSNYVESTALATTNYIIIITNDFQNQILDQSNRVNGVSNYVVTITNDFQDQILNQSNRIDGVSNYVISVTNTLDNKINGVSNFVIQSTNTLRNELTNSFTTKTLVVTNITILGEAHLPAPLIFDDLIITGTISAANFIGNGLGLTNVPLSLSATNYITNIVYQGDLSGSNYVQSTSLATTNYIIGITNDFQNQILNQSNRIDGVSNFVITATNTLRTELTNSIIQGDLSGSNYVNAVALLISNAFIAADAIITNALRISNPVGVMQPWAGTNVPPEGWLICTGQPVDRVTYTNLLLAIGTTYGAGNGTTTFNLPDARGRVLVGRGPGAMFDTLGETGGATNHTLTLAQIPQHDHVIGYKLGGNNINGSGDSLSINYATRDGYFLQNTTYSGSSGSHNNVQPYITINYIIKY